MLVYRLNLTGYIRGRDTSTVTSFYSWPEGKDQDDMQRYVESFKNCFDLIKMTCDYRAN